jgi:hypothetical protein
MVPKKGKTKNGRQNYVNISNDNVCMYVYYLSVYLNGEAAIAVKTPWGRNAIALESP